jgi:hypothetical protein
MTFKYRLLLKRPRSVSVKKIARYLFERGDGAAILTGFMEGGA